MDGSTATATRGAAVEAATLAESFRRTAAEHPDLVAFRRADDSVRLTWSEALERVDAIAGGLRKLGVERGDTIAILLTNRPEFHLIDLAAITIGATPFSIYNTYSPEQIEYVVSDAGAKVAVSEEALVDGVLEARERGADLEHVIVIDGSAGTAGEAGGRRCTALSEVEGSDPGFAGEAAADEVEPQDVLTLIYTSGTTGPPKGVQLSHSNIMSAVVAVQELIRLEPGARVISWLPAAHIAERNAHHYLPVVFAAEVTACPDRRQIAQFLPEVRPNWFFAVPRIWEKIKSGLEAMLASQPEENAKPVRDALDASLQKVRLDQKGEAVPQELADAVAQAEENLFSNLRKMLGLDEVVTVNVGAAPTPVEVLEFFHALGIEIAELWGMSETCGMGTVNPPGKVKIGTVGPAAPGIQVKLAEDGEVMVKGGCVMLGYRGMPDKTAETMEDGFLLTGDIGEIDDDGYLKIVDRKKELIITAAGKNLSPANIEARLKQIPLVSQAVALGDRRRYISALLTLDPEAARAWASEHGSGDDLEALAGNEELIAEVEKGLGVANEEMARVEQVKRFKVLPTDWEPGGDELTPTMKLKRKPIAEKYAEEIDSLYDA